MTSSPPLVKLLKACLSQLESNISPLPAGMLLRAGPFGFDLVEASSFNGRDVAISIPAGLRADHLHQFMFGLRREAVPAQTVQLFELVTRSIDGSGRSEIDMLTEKLEKALLAHAREITDDRAKVHAEYLRLAELDVKWLLSELHDRDFNGDIDSLDHVLCWKEGEFRLNPAEERLRAKWQIPLPAQYTRLQLAADIESYRHSLMEIAWFCRGGPVPTDLSFIRCIRSEAKPVTFLSKEEAEHEAGRQIDKFVKWLAYNDESKFVYDLEISAFGIMAWSPDDYLPSAQHGRHVISCGRTNPLMPLQFAAVVVDCHESLGELLAHYLRGGTGMFAEEVAVAFSRFAEIYVQSPEDEICRSTISYPYGQRWADFR
ncbi:hypothetical protein QA648_28330 (plasmid) [Rhizobium sp. CB3171]|uniref:hypothetical protein n=1 Tax=Rhizobium sp. CB3171 TaxID=3039157 RepID=UPI0024B0C22A|nr:hypothetical protein [Rhizobium sp. CB3171]WFU04677.1 hypothetical protein QA648_28330 [Rhizobium sp. CB3171]